MITLVALLCVAQTFHEHAVLKGHAWTVSSVSFSSDSELLATGSSDGTIKIWDVAGAREQATLRDHVSAVPSAKDAVLAVKFSSKGTLLTSMDYHNKMILWDRVDGAYKSIKSQVFEGVGGVSHFDQQQFGKIAIFSSTKYKYDKTNNANITYWNLNILNIEDSKNMMTIKHDSSITSLSISPDGSLASYGDGQGALRVLSRNERGNLVEINSFTCPLDDEGDPSSPTAIAFHPRDEIVAFACGDNKIRLWRRSDAAPYATLVGHTKWVDSIVFSADGDFIVSGSHDMTIRVWSTKSQKNTQVIQSDNYISSIAISNNNKYIAYGDYNNKANIWVVDR